MNPKQFKQPTSENNFANDKKGLQPIQTESVQEQATNLTVYAA